MAKVAKSTVPNLFTLGNLGFGILSIMMTFQSNYRLASVFIVCAALMDRYDGRVARYLNVSSQIGKELDSLADLVSFGVAPSILIFDMYNFINLPVMMGYVVLLLFPLAGAYRLARYNSTDFSGVFTGIPITIAGLFMALYSFITASHPVNAPLTIILMLILSYLMVSKLKFKKV